MRAAEARIQSFLKLGYFVDYATQRHPLDYSRLDPRPYRALPRPELVRIGAEKLRETFALEFQPGREHVVPLSGGLDSRLILAALLELTEARNIYTFTYGIPETYDYEIGCLVAKHAGTRHITFSLDKLAYHEEELLDFAKITDCQAILFYAPPFWEIERRYRSAVIWSGYVGDAVAGSHLHDPPSRSVDDAKRLYLRSRDIVRSVKLHNCDNEDLVPFIAGASLDPERLTYDEQVLFAEVYKLIEPLLLLRGFDFKTPLINSPWMDFMMSAPNRHRFGEALMIDIARSAFSRLFELPAKSTRGLPLDAWSGRVTAKRAADKGRKLLRRVFPRVADPCLLYNDFNEGIRQSPDLRRIVVDNAMALRSRGIVDWIDIERLVRRHLRRLGNYGDALMVLASLELVHRASEAAS